jgi:hypothetical protein
MNFSDFTRRQLIGTGLGLGLASAATKAVGASSRLAPSASTLSPLHLNLLMQYALDDKLMIDCLRGTFYAVQGAKVTPLHGMILVGLSKTRPLPDGSFQSKGIEVEWFTDLDGAVFDQWKNPLTQQTVARPEQKYMVNTKIHAPDLSIKSSFGDWYHESFTGMRESRDDVWVDGMLVTMSTKLVTYHARRSELMKPGVTRVRTDVSSRVVSDWRPWQQMGNQPGYLLLICDGPGGIGLDELPAEWLEATRKRYPELLPSLDSLLAA